MAVYCKTCGTHNTDPGPHVNLSHYSCGKCHNATLYRKQDTEQQQVGTVLASGVCAALGAAVAGPVGVVVGGLIGYALGNVADKNAKR